MPIIKIPNPTIIQLYLFVAVFGRFSPVSSSLLCANQIFSPLYVFYHKCKRFLQKYTMYFEIIRLLFKKHIRNENIYFNKKYFSSWIKLVFRTFSYCSNQGHPMFWTRSFTISIVNCSG